METTQPRQTRRQRKARAKATLLLSTILVPVSILNLISHWPFMVRRSLAVKSTDKPPSNLALHLIATNWTPARDEAEALQPNTTQTNALHLYSTNKQPKTKAQSTVLKRESINNSPRPSQDVAAPKPCYRKCKNYDNRLIYKYGIQAGLNDRKSIIKYLSNLAGYLCAKVVVPPPGAWLTRGHNGGRKIDHRLGWEQDFFTFHHLGAHPNSSSSALDESQAFRWWRPRATYAKGFFDELPTNWTRLYSNGGEQIVRDLHFLRNYTLFQHGQLERSEQDNNDDDVGNSSMPKPFLWELDGNYYSFRGHINKYLNESHAALDRLSKESDAAEEAAKEQEQRDMLPIVCSGVRREPSHHIVETVREIKHKISNGRPGLHLYGHLHLRRGDAKKDCDTSLDTMKTYLECTFNGTLDALGELPILFGSDETNTTYRDAIKDLVVSSSGGKLRFVDLDHLVKETLKNQVATGQIPGYKVNNYLTFEIGNGVAKNAVLKLVRRRKFSCNACDDLIVKRTATLLRANEKTQDTARFKANE